MLYIFQGVVGNTIQNISGEYVSEDTPVPIPNTAVKLEIAENSMGMPHVKISFCQIFFMQKIFKLRVVKEKSS